MSEDFKIIRTSVHDQVRDYLEAAIRDGEYEPGKALPPERELAATLSVSRHSLRQALASLEGIGVVERRHGSGVYLRASPSDDAIVRVTDVLFNAERSLENVVEARLAIEPYIAAIASERHSDEGMEALRDSIEASDEAAHSGGAARRPGFHSCIAEMSGNSVLAGIVRSLLTGPRGMPRLAAVDPEQLHVWQRDHANIHEAVGDRDAKAAQRLMTNHLAAVLRTAILAEDAKIEAS